MRRKEKEITDFAQIEAIIRQAKVCRLAMSDNNQPYVVPMSFGYRDSNLYFHCAKEGRKLDILKVNPRVCFEIDINDELVTAELACNWGMKYQSVIGFGTASIVLDREEKLSALDIIMQQYTDQKEHEYSEKVLEHTLVIKVAIASMTGKTSGYS